MMIDVRVRLVEVYDSLFPLFPGEEFCICNAILKILKQFKYETREGAGESSGGVS